MKKIIRTISTLLLTLTLILGTSTIAFAEPYLCDDYENEDTLMRVDEHHHCENPVTAYIYVETSDRVYKNDGFEIIGLCDDDVEFVWSDGEEEFFEGIGYKVFTQNKTLVTTLSQGEVWQFSWSLEDGTYDYTYFQNNYGHEKYAMLFNDDMSVLPCQIINPYGEEGSEEDKEENRIMEELNTHSTILHAHDGEPLQLFLMRGDPEWTMDAFDEFYEWAQTKVEYAKNFQSEPEEVEEPEVIEEKVEEVKDVEIIETPKPTPKPVQIPEITPKGSTAKVEKKVPVVPVVIGIILIVGLVVVGIVRSKKK